MGEAPEGDAGAADCGRLAQSPAEGGSSPPSLSPPTTATISFVESRFDPAPKTRASRLPDSLSSPLRLCFSPATGSWGNPASVNPKRGKGAIEDTIPGWDIGGGFCTRLL